MTDTEAIRDLLVRYATAIDTKDWTLFRTCFTLDVATDYGDIGRWSDVEGLTAFMEVAHRRFGATNHMLTNFVIEVDGDRARARTYYHVVLAFPGENAGWVDSVGRYEDRLVRRADGWRIAERRTFVTRIARSS